jgi:hypothetical protein
LGRFEQALHELCRIVNDELTPEERRFAIQCLRAKADALDTDRER